MPYIIGEEYLRNPLLRRQGDGGTVTPPGSTTTEPPTSTTPTSTPTSTTPSTTSEPTTTPTSSTPPPDSTTSTPPNDSTTSVPPPASSTQPGQSTTTPGPTSTTSMYETTAVITQGSTVFTTVFTTGTSVPAGGGGGGSRSNTGAIVGGVVGGILGLLALIIVFWWIRKRNKNIKLDEDIFDPDRTAKRPGRLSGGIDLNDPTMEARPYNVPTATGSTTAVGSGMAGAGAGIRAATSAQSHEGSQYYNHHGPSPGEVFNYNQQVPGPYGTGIYPPNARPVSIHLGGPAEVSRGPSDASHYPPSSSAYYPPAPSSVSDGGRSGVGGAFLAMPSGALPFSATTQSSSSASQKAHYAQQDRLQIANPADEAAGPVMQHQDGGRVQTEVPPAYDSIPQDDGAGPSSSAAVRAREEAAGPEKGARS